MCANWCYAWHTSANTSTSARKVNAFAASAQMQTLVDTIGTVTPAKKTSLCATTITSLPRNASSLRTFPLFAA